MRVMISQPMRDRTEKQIIDERKKVIDKLRGFGWKVVDTLFKDNPEKKCNTTVYYLGKSIDAISKVDAVLFMNGWDKARGCKIEHEVCLQYNIPTIYEYELFEKDSKLLKAIYKKCQELS